VEDILVSTKERFACIGRAIVTIEHLDTPRLNLDGSVEEAIEAIMAVPGAHAKLALRHMLRFGEVVSYGEPQFFGSVHSKEQEKWDAIWFPVGQRRQDSVHRSH
jgi:hypothetical protein